MKVTFTNDKGEVLITCDDTPATATAMIYEPEESPKPGDWVDVLDGDVYPTLDDALKMARGMDTDDAVDAWLAGELPLDLAVELQKLEDR